MIFDTDGLRILALDSARVALVNVFLDAHNFEEYSCMKRVTAGVNISNTYKILKSISGSDIMTMDLTDNESIRITVHNDTKKMTTTHELKLLDINDEGLDVPDITLENVTIVPSAEFQKICRDMGQLSQYVTIRRRGGDFEMSCDGDFANQKTIIAVSDSESDLENVFSLKYINMFTKATNMSHSLEIFQGQDMPIIFRYCIANLGDLKFYLAPNVD
jgi:proliferating cell nuclear antigen